MVFSTHCSLPSTVATHPQWNCSDLPKFIPAMNYFHNLHSIPTYIPTLNSDSPQNLTSCMKLHTVSTVLFFFLLHLRVLVLVFYFSSFISPFYHQLNLHLTTDLNVYNLFNLRFLSFSIPILIFSKNKY